MSRIFEALKGMEAERAAHGAPDKDSLGVMELPELRRYPRRELSAPLTVYGRGPAGAPFYQEVDVVNVSADGGLIVMRTSVCEGQELLLINNHSSQEQLCHVVRVRSRDVLLKRLPELIRMPWTQGLHRDCAVDSGFDLAPCREG